ncbi:ABC transporter permease [Granulicella sp. L46]|uniref:ABC transporter permease n=1 Tax=Granulicella sp. L46 TaxID=1641865 RepID=UPI00131EB0F7|nr:ABC transporter permease [Granulicella sp. L46]
MPTILQDLRYALRQMLHAPGFALSVVLVLALGIGANAAMFTVLEGTLFRPLPYSNPEQLVMVTATTTRDTGTFPRLADMQVWRDRTRAIDKIAYFSSSSAYLLTQNSAQKISSVIAGANLFDTLGVRPALGRNFTTEEQQPGRDNVVLLSDMVWRSQFHADPQILGQTVRVDETPGTVIGVMPKGFAFPAGANEPPAQVWRPAALDAAALTRALEGEGFQMVARLHRGTSIPTVDAELNAIQKQLLPLYNDKSFDYFAPAHIHVVDYRRSLTEKDQRTALLALFGAVAALWLIACANVACLMLARAASRRREMAVRSALGASRWRLTRQTLVESALLSLAGAAVGLALSQGALRFFEHSLNTHVSPYLSLHADARVLFALLALSLLSAVLFGVLPARIASNASVEQALRRDGAQAGTGRRQHRLQRILVVSELSLTLVLLVSCGLLLRTVFALRKVPLGFRTDHVFVLDPKLPDYKYKSVDKNNLIFKPLLDRVKAIPGVDSAAITTVAPLDNRIAVQLTLGLGKNPKDAITANLQASGPELQKVLGFGMARGRYFNAQDTPDAPLAAVVNHAFARAYEPNNGDVSHFTLSVSTRKGVAPRSFKIVGVIDDLHQVGITDPAMPEIDIDAAQMRPDDGVYQPTVNAHIQLLLRSSRDPKSLIPELRHVMQQLNPDLASTDIRTMDQIVDDAMGSQILAAHLLETLGGLALLVALAGLYSLLAYLVTLRTRELGLRLALGAQRADILTLVLRGAGVLLLTGIIVGVALSLLTAHLLHSLLFGVTQYDPITLITAPVLLLLIGTFAAWLPARRAAHLEPMQALRTE